MPTLQVHPDDVFYECNGAGDCGTPEHYVPGQQWALNKVGAPQAWKYTTGSRKVKVRFRLQIMQLKVLQAMQQMRRASAAKPRPARA